MSGGTALAVVMSISAGFAGSMQAAALGRLGDRVGTVEAVGFSTLVAGATGILVLLVARRSRSPASAHAFHQPLWMWLGGILSAFIVLSITFAAPKIGVAAAIGLVITGNLVVAALIDRFGWFGVEQIPLDWTRVVGILLLAGGAALVLNAWRLDEGQLQRPTMSSGRTGTRVSSRPVASRSAETIAAVETTVGGSPTPFTP